jgi:hypothetical protein
VKILPFAVVAVVAVACTSDDGSATGPNGSVAVSCETFPPTTEAPLEPVVSDAGELVAVLRLGSAPSGEVMDRLSDVSFDGVITEDPSQDLVLVYAPDELADEVLLEIAQTAEAEDGVVLDGIRCS